MRKMMPKNILWVTFGGFLVTGLVIIAAVVALHQNTSPPRVADSTGHNSGTATTDIVTSPEEIPLYPNSIINSEGCPHPEVNDCWQELYANASITEVVQYSKGWLKNAGWIISKEMKGTLPGARIDFGLRS
jgi:hypothetical protein